MTYTCVACGTKKTVEIAALGHTATEYSDGNMYAVYSEESEAWYTQCGRCDEWVVEIDESNIYEFILVAKDEASLDAAIEVAKVREDGSDVNRTQILVYGTIEISETSYVLIDCDNVEIYGLGAESSKIVESEYEGDHSGTAKDGVEITGSNVTIRDLAIDGTALNNVEGDTHNYKHAVEIKQGAENVTISDCVITGGGTATNDSSICIMNGTGTVKIVDCILSGAASGLVIEYNGQSIEVDVSGGKIDAIRPIWIDGGGGVTLNVENAEILGRSELGPNAAITFTDCTFGYHIDGETAYGSVDVYGVITFKNCKFLANDTEDVTLKDGNLKESNNYVIGAYYDNVTIYLIGCTFENTNSELAVEDAEDSMVAVDENTFIYIVAGDNDVYSCSLYFSDSDNATQYIYDKTTNTVMEYVEEEPDDENP